MKALIAKAIVVAVLIGAVGVVLINKRARSGPAESVEATTPAPAVETTRTASAPPKGSTAQTATGAAPATAAPAAPAAAAPDGPASGTVATVQLPRLLDLGSKSCIPCKMMAPILEELKKEQAGKLQVDFIDVWVDKAAAQQYRIRLIPTQIFFDASGKERFRHEGFMSREDILAKCRELGFELATGAAAAQPLTGEGAKNG
jgi:thioredoxin 1